MVFLLIASHLPTPQTHKLKRIMEVSAFSFPASKDFSLAAAPAQPPFSKTPLERFVENLGTEAVTSEDLSYRFDECLSQLDQGSYYAHLACQILQHAVAFGVEAFITSSEGRIKHLRIYYEGNLTYTSTRKGEESFAQPMRSTAAYYLSFIVACERDIESLRVLTKDR